MIRYEQADGYGTIVIDETAGGPGVTVSVDTGRKSKDFTFSRLTDAEVFAGRMMTRLRGKWRETESQWAADWRSEQGTY